MIEDSSEKLPAQPAPQAHPSVSGPTEARATVSSAGSPAAALPLDRPFLGRYGLIEQLGRGAMGVVWKAWDTELDRMVALKLVREEGVSGDAATARFVREARLAAGLRHPGIVGVIDAGSVDGRLYLTMEMIEGRSFDRVLAETRPAKRSRAVDAHARLRDEIATLAEIAEAVGHAHARGVVHRDLKPANVLIDGAGRARVTDFGLAKEAVSAGERERLTLDGEMLGTPAYMSPEQADGNSIAVGPRSDVWALGVMLFEILTGELPFAAKTAWDMIDAIRTGEAEPPSRRMKQTPPALDLVCRKALERDPARRYEHATALGAELRRWLQGSAVRASTPGAWRAVLRRRRVLVPAALVLAFVAASIGWAVFERGDARLRARALLEPISEAVLGLEHELMRTRVPDEARRNLSRQPLGLLEPVIRDVPDFGPAYAWRGRVHDLLGEFAAADRDFDQACALAPESSTVWYLRAFHRLEHYAKTRPRPDLQWGPRGLAVVPGRSESAEETLLREGGLSDLERSAGAADQDFIAVRDLVVLARAQAEFFSGASGGFERVLTQLEGAEGPPAWRTRGRALFNLRRFVAAVAELDRALAVWPEDREARLDRGLARLGCGIEAMLRGDDGRAAYRGAAEDLAAYLMLVPDRPSGLRVRSICLRLLGEAELRHGGDAQPPLAEAIEGMDKLLPAGAGSIADLRERALAHLALGEAMLSGGGHPGRSYAAALADLDGALRDALAPAAYLVERGNVRLKLGQFRVGRGLDPGDAGPLAVADYTEALRRDPGAMSARRYRPEAILRLCPMNWNPRDPLPPLVLLALEDAEACLVVSPTDREVRWLRGAARMHLGDCERTRGRLPDFLYSGALEDLRAAVRAGSRTAEPALGILLHRLGREREALDLLEPMALVPGPRGEWARARVAEARRAQETQSADWARQFVQAHGRMQEKEYAAAKLWFDWGFDCLEQMLGTLPEAERARRRADPELRDNLWRAHYNRACVECFLAREEPGPTGKALDAEARNACRVRALDDLEAAIGQGFRDGAQLRTDPDLAPLHDEARFQALLEQLK